MKTLLGITSLLMLLLLAVAAARENYFSEWRQLQREYRRVLLAKAAEEAEVQSAREFRVEIRQVVVPDLGRVDRCVSCHLGLDDPRMTDVPQPFAVHSGRYLADHPPEKFGCTACHLGQGRATSSRDAHARDLHVSWEQPTLPAPYVQASCGVCHDPEHLSARGAPVLAAGFGVFRSQGCLGCHQLGDRGGSIGPELDTVGDKGRHAFSFAKLEGEHSVWSWHTAHFEAPKKVVPDSKMPAVKLPAEEIQALATYVLSLRTSNLTERLAPRDRYEQRYQVWHTAPLSGEELYRQFCYSCHGEGVETVLHDTLDVAVPSIRNSDFLAVTSRDFLVRGIRDGRPATVMPAWGEAAGGLTANEIERIVDYLLAARVTEREVTFVMAPNANARRGEEVFRRDCTDCHGVTREEGTAPWLGGAGFQASYSDALIGHVIVNGRAETLMIPWGVEAGGDYDDETISDLVAFIRTLG